MVKEIIWNSVCNSLGYGVASSNILHELNKLTKVDFFPIGNLEITDQKIQESVQNCLNNSLTTDFSSPSIRLWHEHDLIFHPGLGKYFGWPFFELDNFSPQQLLSLSSTDALIVSSQWAKGILQRYLEKEIYVIPLGIDPDIFYPSQNENNGPFKFFNVGKIEYRKGHDVLIECFNRAFTKEDDVELHMMWHNPFLSEQQTNEWVNLYKDSELGNKIILHNRVNTHQEVSCFMRKMDVGIFISRAEGFNLELLESMSLGKSVICTNYSAHTEFCNETNSFLVEINDMEQAFDGVFFDGNKGNWAYIGESQKEQIIEHMRYCYNNRPYNKEGVLTGKNYTWANSAKELLNVVSN